MKRRGESFRLLELWEANTLEHPISYEIGCRLSSTNITLFFQRNSDVN
jgi:hypothetical protein